MQAMIPFENLLNQVWFMSWKNLVLQFWLEMLLANQIAVFFDHQFLWRELIIPQIFLHEDNHQVGKPDFNNDF